MSERFLIAVWVALLAMLGVSVALGSWGNVLAATVLIFLIAVIKATLVAAYYMRLKWEPRYILWILFAGVGLMAVLYFALVPDIMHGYGK